MKNMTIKRMLTAVLAGTMIVGSALTVSASTTQTSEGTNQAVTDAEAVVSGEEKSVAGSSSTSTATVAVKASYTKSSVTIGGVAVKSTVGGVFIAPNVNGVAVTTPLADINAAFGITAGQVAKIMVLEANAANSPLAYAVAQNAAAGLNGSVVAMLNVEFGVKENGRYTDLADNGAKANMAVGLPTGANTNAQYKVLCIKAGGAVTVMNDLDTDPTTVTFDFVGGKAAYALVAIN